MKLDQTRRIANRNSSSGGFKCSIKCRDRIAGHRLTQALHTELLLNLVYSLPVIYPLKE